MVLAVLIQLHCPATPPDTANRRRITIAGPKRLLFFKKNLLTNIWPFSLAPLAKGVLPQGKVRVSSPSGINIAARNQICRFSD